MTKEKRLAYLKRMKKEVEVHQIAREIDMVYARDFEMKEAVKIQKKDYRKQKVQEVKNYADLCKDQVQKDKDCVGIIDDMIKKLEEELAVKE